MSITASQLLSDDSCSIPGTSNRTLSRSTRRRPSSEASASAIKTAVELLDDAVVADDAAFTAGTTKLHMSGFVLDNTSSDALDENDAGAARITSDRRQIVQLGESGAKYVKGGGSKTDTTAQSLMAASGDATTSNYLCWVTVYNSSATNTAVEIRDGTTTVVAVIPAPAYGGATSVPTYPIKMTANTPRTPTRKRA